MSWTVIRWKNHFLYNKNWIPEHRVPHYSVFRTIDLQLARDLNKGSEMIIIHEFDTQEQALLFQRNIAECL